MTLEKFKESIKNDSDEDLACRKAIFQKEIENINQRINAINAEEHRREKNRKEEDENQQIKRLKEKREGE